MLTEMILNVAKGKDFSEDFEFVTQFYESDFDKDKLKSELEMFQAAFSSQSLLQETTFKDILEYFKRSLGFNFAPFCVLHLIT